MPLFSVPMATKKGLDVVFMADGRAMVVCGLQVSYNELLTTGTRDQTDGLFYLDADPVNGPPFEPEYEAQAMPMVALAATAAAAKRSDLDHWHSRLGHLGQDNLRLLQKQAAGSFAEANLRPSPTRSVCDPCVIGKLR